MSDSCRARKLEPGLAQAYSKPSDFRTSTMKSEPGRSAVRTSTSVATGSVSLASAVAEGTPTLRRVSGACAFTEDWPTSAAALAAAAPFKKPRRPEGFFDFAMLTAASYLQIFTVNDGLRIYIFADHHSIERVHHFFP